MVYVAEKITESTQILLCVLDIGSGVSTLNSLEHRRNLGKGGSNASPKFFLPNNSCFGYRVEDGQIKEKYTF